jgi:hypothetical protein
MTVSSYAPSRGGGFWGQSFANVGVGITLPTNAIGFTKKDTIAIDTSQVDWSTELFNKLDMAAALVSGFFAEAVYEYASDPANYPRYYPDANRPYTDAQSYMRHKRESGKYRYSWVFAGTGFNINNSTDRGVGSYSVDGYYRKLLKGRKFRVFNTKRRFADSGTKPIAKYLEYGGARKPADKGRHILIKAIYHTSHAMKQPTAEQKALFKRAVTTAIYLTHDHSGW